MRAARQLSFFFVAVLFATAAIGAASESAMKAKNPSVVGVLKQDKWEIAEVLKPGAPAMLRYRVPVLGPEGVEGYEKALRVLWAYADADSGALPTEQDSEDMGRFEDRLSHALQHDAHGFLAAVLTFDGARQWVFYTNDITECGRRINKMPQEKGRYPIEIDAFDDPRWEYLRGTLMEKFK